MDSAFSKEISMRHLVTETVEIARWHSTDRVLNQYLSLGWIIVESWVVGDGGPDRLEKAHFLVGWIDRATKPVHPPKEKDEPLKF